MFSSSPYTTRFRRDVPSTGDMNSLIKEKLINTFHSSIFSSLPRNTQCFSKRSGARKLIEDQVTWKNHEVHHQDRTNSVDHVRVTMRTCTSRRQENSASMTRTINLQIWDTTGSQFCLDVQQRLHRECSWQHHCLRHDGQGIVQHCQEPGSAASKKLVPTNEMKEVSQQLFMQFPGFVIDRFVQSKMTKVRQKVAECPTVTDDIRHTERNAAHDQLQHDNKASDDGSPQSGEGCSFVKQSERQGKVEIRREELQLHQDEGYVLDSGQHREARSRRHPTRKKLFPLEKNPSVYDTQKLFASTRKKPSLYHTQKPL